MSTINLLVFSWGEVKCPRGREPPHPRKDGQPDKRFKSGSEWWAWFWQCEKRGALV